MAENEHFEGWAIVELFGHRRLGGYIRDVEVFGGVMCRIDVPTQEGQQVTQFYGGSAIFSLTPCSEEAARAVARFNDPAPVHRFELPPAPSPSGFVTDDPDGDQDDDEAPF